MSVGRFLGKKECPCCETMLEVTYDEDWSGLMFDVVEKEKRLGRMSLEELLQEVHGRFKSLQEAADEESDDER